MSKRATRGSTRQVSRPVDPMGTLPIFDTTSRDGLVVAAGRFRCGLCNTMGVDEPGELCEVCADHVLTEKCRYTRPADAEKTARRAPRKSTVRKPRKATSSAASAAAGRDAG